MATASEDDARFLAEASPLLDAALDLRATLDSIARIAIPHLADLCLVDVVEAGEVRRVASAAADPAVRELLRALPRRYVARDGEDDPVSRVMTTRRSEVVHAQAGALFGPAVQETALLVPLLARDRALGVLVLGASSPGRTLGADELAVAEDLGRRAALALDNAMLFEHQREVARMLQESLVPELLPALDGLELGAAFRPAGDGTEIGGDFYDVITAADGAATLAVGDVTGKGARAAAMTAMARHTLRTAAMYEVSPRAMLHVLNRALLALPGPRGSYCTVALCRLAPDAARGTVDVDVASAGHPLPLVLRRAGAVERAGRRGTLLGYVEDAELHEVRVTLAEGDALVLYTDGLTDVRTPDGLLGEGRLEAALGSCAGAGAGAIAAHLEQTARDVQAGPPGDDVAILVARVL